MILFYSVCIMQNVYYVFRGKEVALSGQLNYLYWDSFDLLE